MVTNGVPVVKHYLQYMHEKNVVWYITIKILIENSLLRNALYEFFSLSTLGGCAWF